MEAAILRFFPKSPTQVRMSSWLQLSVSLQQQDANRRKMIARFGFDKAENICEYCPILLVLYFDIYRMIAN